MSAAQPATLDAPPQATCRGRAVFETEVDALADARDHHATLDRKLGAYPCGNCGGWHLERRRWLR